MILFEDLVKDWRDYMEAENPALNTNENSNRQRNPRQTQRKILMIARCEHLLPIPAGNFYQESQNCSNNK